MGVATAGAGVVDTLRGRNLARANDTDWKASDTAKSMLIPFVTPDSIIKKKLRNQE